MLVNVDHLDGLSLGASRFRRGYASLESFEVEPRGARGCMDTIHSRDRGRLLPRGLRDTLATAAFTIFTPQCQLPAQRCPSPLARNDPGVLAKNDPPLLLGPHLLS